MVLNFDYGIQLSAIYVFKCCLMLVTFIHRLWFYEVGIDGDRKSIPLDTIVRGIVYFVIPSIASHSHIMSMTKKRSSEFLANEMKTFQGSLGQRSQEGKINQEGNFNLSVEMCCHEFFLKHTLQYAPCIFPYAEFNYKRNNSPLIYDTLFSFLLYLGTDYL